MTVLLALIAAVAGLAAGSFLNVVIHRVPKKESVVHPRSRCPTCGTQLAARDNIPVVSWLLLRGRCRTCGTPISARYPLVELATALLFAAVAVRFHDHPEAIPAFCVFVASLLAISVIDLELYIIPNRIVYPTLFIGAPLLAVAAAVGHDLDAIRQAAIGGVGAWLALLILHLISPRGMGFGDVRLSAVIGMFLGWIGLGRVPLGLFLGFLLATVVSLPLLILRRKGRKDPVPFGPFLAAGATLAMFFGGPLIDAYLGR
jgi:leader peptidase (prepilin peptidase)/N-methyltransferase